MKKFDIVIVSWNRLEYLKRTVGSLIQAGVFRDAERVIIVDNGSTEPGLISFLEELREMNGVFLVLLPHNRGWGQAVNECLSLSRAEFLFVSNNDVDYNTPDFHNQMIKMIEESAAFSLDTKGIGILGVWRHIGHGLVRGGLQNEQFDEMDNVPAVGWMMPKSAMEKVGMLPEHGVCLTKGGNGEDTAYVNRMKAAGYLVGVPKKDIAVHIDGY